MGWNVGHWTMLAFSLSLGNGSDFVGLGLCFEVPFCLGDPFKPANTRECRHIQIEFYSTLTYLINLFQMRSASDDTITSLRSVTNKNFLIPKPKLNLFKNSLSYSGAIIWNSIPLEIKTSKSLDSFVNKCKAWMKQG